MTVQEAEAVINAARPDQVVSNCGIPGKWVVRAVRQGRTIAVGRGRSCEEAWTRLGEAMRQAS